MNPNNPINHTPLNLGNSQVASPKKSNTLLTVLITALIVTTVGLVVYILLNMVSPKQNQQATQPSNFVQATVAPTATVTPTPGIDQAVSAVNLGTDEADFNTIQKDINRL